MFENEETALKELGNRLNSTSSSSPEAIDAYILKGIHDGHRIKRKNRTKSLSLITAAVFITIFVTSVRISPTFAAAASKIPGLEYIVKMINYDRGLTDAVSNDFVQHLGISQEHENLKLTIKDIICDESRMIVFYSLENKGKHRVVDIHEISFTDKTGKTLPACISWGTGQEIDMEKTLKYDGMVELNLVDNDFFPEKLFAVARLHESNPYDELVQKFGSSSDLIEKHRVILASKWKYEINIDTNKFKNRKTVYQMNKATEVEGQKVIFKKLVLTPTLARLDVEFDRSNTKKLLYFDDINLLDENNDKWGTIMNGVTVTKPDDFHQTIYFQSSYFRKPKELYITGSSIRAVDADKSIVALDVSKKLLVNTPESSLKLNTVDIVDNKLIVELTFKTDKSKDKNKGYCLFDNNITDEAGNKFIKLEDSSSNDGTLNIGHNKFIIGDANKMKEYLYLKINDYPQRVVENFKIKVK